MNLKEIFTFNSESSELVLTKDDELFLEKIAKKIHQHGMVTHGREPVRAVVAVLAVQVGPTKRYISKEPLKNEN